MLFHNSLLRHIMHTLLVTREHILPFNPMLLQIESDVTPFNKIVTPHNVFILVCTHNSFVIAH